ncbi:transmembrane protein 272-like [Centropristis striata]|uniref:transmembrane protein 272-like n=1 Tax=Centropristis striata TaxID=184440 RepID=UPI0027DF0EBD|nr:transmembrane protein 272-like [Centropristis striata]
MQGSMGIPRLEDFTIEDLEVWHLTRCGCQSQSCSSNKVKSARTTGISKVLCCAIPIAQIALGAIHLDDCPRQHYIPIYLIVVGVFSLVLSVLSCLPCTQEPEEGPSTPLSRAFTTWNSLTSLFLFCWFIAGNVWIYSIYKPNYNKNTTNVDPYCDKTLYLFAFWTTTVVYILLLLFLLIGCCVCCCMFLCGQADPDDDV